MLPNPATPATALSRDRILACAVRLADEAGLHAASLRGVAGTLNVHVTSLYNHVPTKDALLDGIAEELLAGAGFPVGDLRWEQWVRQFADAFARLARNHPGAFAVLLRRPVQGARAAATFEAGLAAFSRAGMDPPEAVGAVRSVALALLGCCAELAQLAAGHDQATDMTPLSREEFPELNRAAEVEDHVVVLTTLTEILVAGLASGCPPATPQTPTRSGPEIALRRNRRAPVSDHQDLADAAPAKLAEIE